MVYFSKLPGMVALCIVVLARTLGSAAPVPQIHDVGGVAAITEALVDVADPLLTGVGSAVGGAADAKPEADDPLGDPLHDILKDAGIALTNASPAVWDTCGSNPNDLHRMQLIHPFKSRNPKKRWPSWGCF